jgi:hypothetical protein
MIDLYLLHNFWLNHLQAGGKEDSSQGVGTNVDKVGEALAAAKEYLEKAKGLN